MRVASRIRAVPTELWVLTVLSFATRWWQLYTPGVRVFDEVHFEEYVSRYVSGSYYMDVHPPLGKLLYALTAWLVRVPGERLMAGVSTPELRVLPALLGALLVPTFWWLLRELGATRKVAALGAVMVLLDPFTLVLSRLVLLDMLLLWFGIAAIAAFLAARRCVGGARWRWMTGAALLAGAAVSTKWTGLATVGLMGTVWLIDAARTRSRGTARGLAAEGVLLVAAPTAVYLAAFAVHFALLPNDGIGTTLMSPAFAATRVGNAAFHPDARMGFAAELVDVHRAMMSANARLETVAQPGASAWYTWPVATHRLRIWQEIVPRSGETRSIELLGNPVLWYGIVAAVALFAGALVSGRVAPGALRAPLTLLVTGYVMNVAPFAFIARPMYLYHYTFGLLYSAALAAFGIGVMAGWQDDDGPPWRFALWRGRALYAGLLGALLLSFAFFAPLAYGTPLSAGAVAARWGLLERH